MRFYRSFIRNFPLANISFLVVLLVGIAGYLQMPREKDPEINFNWVMVTTPLPGASAEDVEKLVTKPLEDAIKGVADVRFTMSSSRENVSSILVRFYDIPERVFDKRINDLRRDLQNKAESELPPDAKEPRVLEITSSNGFATAMVAISGQAADEVLRDRARLLRDEIERMKGVDQVFATGLRDPELLVRFLPSALSNRGLLANDVADSVYAWFRDTFAGNIETSGVDEHTVWQVRMIGQDANPEQLARVPVSGLGRGRDAVPLDSLAEVTRSRAKASSLASIDGKPAVILAVTKKARINTLELIDRISAFIAERNPALARDGIRMALLDDQTVPTREAIRVMETNALQGLILVLLITWLFLGTRISLLVGLGIPFALTGTFAVLNALGYTLNISVLLGVVIALGMLVDDAVVVVETMYYRMQRGESSIDAAVNALREVFAPVTASVATTMAAFLPLMLLPGIVGKFMFIIPFVVTLALAISLIEAFWMLPSHMQSARQNVGDGSFRDWRDRFNHWLRVKYSLLLVAVLRRPRRSLAFSFGLVLAAVLVVSVGLVRIQFFAFDPLRIFYINVDMPAGASLEETLRQAEILEQRARARLKPEEVRDVASYAGIKFTDTEPLYGDAYGQVVVSLKPRDGGREVEEIVQALRPDVESVPTSGKISVTLKSGGPPLAKPIKVRVRGDDPAELRAAADAVLAIVRGVRGTHDLVDDDIPGRPELVLKLNREALRAAGLDAGRVSRLLRLHVDGEIIAMMRDRGEKIEVRVRALRDQGNTVGQDILRLLDDPVALPGGGTTTLGALVDADTRIGKGVIKHYNLRRAITIEADLDKEKTDTVAANRIIADAWKKEAARFPNTEIDFSGELDDIYESLDAMGFLFLFGVGLIYLILATQFRSYYQPLLILVTVPLAFTGVVLGLLISRIPLSLYTLYGVIALTGIAVNSAIVLISAANERLEAGMSTLHATVYAARRRVVPILITTTTTIGGLFSLAVGLGGKSLLWGPVAASIVWGLSFSTVLTLFVVPLLYWMSMRWRARK